jgi:hypothetical protein
MRVRTVQSSFLSGVLDPRAAGRVETDAYNQGLYTGENVIVHHLGGVRRRPGLRFIERLSNVLTREIPTEITTPEGDSGTVPANANDDDETTVVEGFDISTTNPFVVVRYDLGSAKTVRHVDIRRIVLTGGTSDEFVLQYSVNDSFWATIGTTMIVDTVERSYRMTPLTGPSQITAQYWRVARVGATDLGTEDVTIGEFNIWTETATISNVRVIPFELNTSEQYFVVLTDRSGFVYQNGELIPGGYFPTPYLSADLPDIDAVVGIDALLLVHEDYAPRTLIRDTVSSTFQLSEIVFDSVPQFDFDDDDSPTPTSEIQVITFDANWKEGDTFQIALDGARSALITFAGDASAAQQTTTAANIAREVQKLFSVPGFTGVSVARTGALAYTVTFANASAKTYEGLMSVTVGTTSSATAPAAAVTRTQAGVSRHEDAWSATRGYPRTVTFFQGRLYFGGTRSKLQSVIASAVNDVLNFELGEQLDSDPIFTTLNGQQLNAINALFSGRNLQLFTSGGEFRYVKREGDPITPADAPAPQTQYGAKKVRPVAIDGSTVFVQRLGKSIRDFKFDFNEDAYNSLGLSSLAPHLINSAVDVSAWQGSATDEINLIFVVNTDGTVAVLNLRREAEVRAWTHWVTQGTFKAVAASIEDVYFAVEREIGGTQYLYLEVIDEDMYMDAAVLKNYELFGVGADYAVVFTEADPLVGEECRATVDGFPVENVTPSIGNVFIPVGESFEVNDTTTEVRIGLNFDPTVTPMPLNTLTPIGSNAMDKRRVRKVRVRVDNTLGLLVNGRELPDRYWDINSFDEPLPDPVSKAHTIEESTDWDETQDKFVVFTQTDPLPMHILAIYVDMESA